MTRQHMNYLVGYIMPNYPNIGEIFDNLFEPNYKSVEFSKEEMLMFDRNPLCFNRELYDFKIDSFTLCCSEVKTNLSNGVYEMSVNTFFDYSRRNIYNYALILPANWTDRDRFIWDCRTIKSLKVTNDQTFKRAIKRTEERFEQRVCPFSKNI